MCYPLLRWKVTLPVFTFRSYTFVSNDKRSTFRTNLDVYFVATQNNGYVLANPLKISVPIGDVFVGDPRGHVEHNDAALPLDIITIPQTTKFFLPSGVPNVETDVAKVCMERQRVYLYSERS